MLQGFKLKAVLHNRISSIIRFAITGSIACSTATFSNWIDYESYWNGTIYRTQTVDFNILSYTLPTKLSYALQKRNFAELQRTLNSNYGLFGLVVTNCKTQEKECPTQKFWYSSKSDRSWKKQLKLKDLSQHPYDLLRNPLPLVTEAQYNSSRAKERTATGQNNAGEIIGRVYYVRGIPPTFIEDYWKWIKNPLSTSGAHKYYSLKIAIFILGGFASWVILEFVLYKRRKNQEQLKQQIRILRHQFNEQQRHNILLQAECKQFNELLHNQETEIKIKNEEQFYLETLIEDLQEQKKEHDHKLAQIQTQLIQVQKQRELYTNTITQLKTQLAQAQEDLNEDVVAQVEAQLQQAHQQRELDDDIIHKLEAQLAQAHQQSELDDNTIVHLETKLVEVRREKEEFIQKCTLLQDKLVEVELQRQTAEHLVSQLKNQLENQINKRQKQSSEIEIVEKQLAQERQARERDKQTIIQLKLEIGNYKKQENLDNKFEREIKCCIDNLINEVGLNCRVLTSFDVASGRRASRVVDLIIILNSSCVVTIEAKSYKGKIKADGEPRNNKWFCYQNNQKILIKSASFPNPYCQVMKYAQTIGKTLNDYTQYRYNPISVYGVIVFPQEADISKIKGELGRHYEIITLDNLETFLQEIEKHHRDLDTQGKLLSTRNIENVLRGKVASKPSAIYI